MDVLESHIDWRYWHDPLNKYIEPREHEKLSQVELLVVDEAAAIPLPAVWSLLGPYLVFRLSTVNEKLARCRYDLPKELWVEIMTRLPVYAQLRCKSVQKSWNRHINTLIRDKTFVAKHLKNSIDRPSLFIVSHHHLPSSEIGEFAFATICNTNDDNCDNSDHIDTVIENFDILSATCDPFSRLSL
ncbi:uncharacterized protein LOC21391731 [Morus notabilis]|uniref:uncharacterized protein LOC21391731 n=1 Tax=Morus notabilis TaxID=981085 RepID=UPI000CED7D4A|nr:uncharacterized protein LOC21391731 [Morus notabilis]